MSQERNKKLARISGLIILIIIPALLIFGMTVLNDRKYIFISLLMLLLTTVPFLLLFERRGIRSRYRRSMWTIAS